MIEIQKPVERNFTLTMERENHLILPTAFHPINKYNQSHLVFDLYMAVASGSTQEARNILLSYPHVDFNIPVKGATALSLSLYKRHFDIFYLLMRHYEKSKNLNLNKSSKDHLNRVEPPIITACRMHFFEGVVALVNAGADIDAADNYNHTALWVACRQQMPDLVEYLISNGASVNKTDQFNRTPLLTALTYRVSTFISKYLIVNGSNLQGPKYPIGGTSAQYNPLFWASKHKAMEIVKLLLCAGIPLWEIRSVRRALIMDGDNDMTVLGILDAEINNPPSLKQLCRMGTRTCISRNCNGKEFLKNIETLPLPVILKQYLSLRVLYM